MDLYIYIYTSIKSKLNTILLLTLFINIYFPLSIIKKTILRFFF